MVRTVINESVISTEYSSISTLYSELANGYGDTIVTAVKPSMSQTDPLRPITTISRDPLFGLLSESQPITMEYLYLYGVRHLISVNY